MRSLCMLSRTMQRNHMRCGMMGIGDYYLENGYQRVIRDDDRV